MTRKSIAKVTSLLLVVGALGFAYSRFDDWRLTRQLAKARQALKDRDVDRAMREVLDAERLNPKSGEVALCIAKVFRRQGNLIKFRESLEKAARLGLSRDRIRREEWLAMAQLGQMREVAPFRPELFVNPGDDGPEICEAFANGYFLTFQLDEAFRILDAWEKDYPQDPQPYRFRAMFCNKTSSWSQAVVHLRHARKLAPTRSDIQLELATALLALRQTDEAAELLEQLMATQLDVPDVLSGWAQVLVERNQVDEARVTLERLLQLDSDNPVALRAIGQLQLSAGMVSDAIQYLEKAVAKKPHDLETRYSLATALQKNGQDADARQHYEYAVAAQEAYLRLEKLVEEVKSRNDNVAARFEITELLRKYGEPNERLLWLRSIVTLDPSHKAAHAELADFYEKMGNLEEARKHSLLSGATVSP